MPNRPLVFDNYLEGLALFASLLPADRRFYSRARNRVRDFLLDLGDCVRAINRANALHAVRRRSGHEKGLRA